MEAARKGLKKLRTEYPDVADSRLAKLLVDPRVETGAMRGKALRVTAEVRADGERLQVRVRTYNERLRIQRSKIDDYNELIDDLRKTRAANRRVTPGELRRQRDALEAEGSLACRGSG